MLPHGEDLAHVADLRRRFSVPSLRGILLACIKILVALSCAGSASWSCQPWPSSPKTQTTAKSAPKAMSQRLAGRDAGELVVALNLVFVDETFAEITDGSSNGAPQISDVMDEKPKVWTSFKLHSDGFAGRVLAYSKAS